MRAIATLRPTRQRLLQSCAVAAGLIALAHGGPALAQVNGTGTPTVPGAATISPGIDPGTAGPTTDVVVAGSGGNPHAIINWTPTDTAPTGGTINFLPDTEILNFYGTDPAYVVLNRFVTGTGGSISRQIGLYGEVNSYVGSPGGSTNTQGGAIWFYNAGGILIGPDAVMNVGSLILTANDIDTTGGLFGPSGTIRFRGATNSQSAIEISSGAFIGAQVAGSPGDSYIAMVAPRIIQRGAVSADGSTAYVAAESADIRINAGLFDIDVLTGAVDGEAIVHTGGTSGEAHLDASPNDNRIYFVAVPKNNAVSMLVSGRVGYADATVAQTEPNGAVRLAAGYNVVAGELAATPATTTGTANMTVADALFPSSITARASGAMTVGPQQLLPPPFLPAAPPPGQGRVVVNGGNGLFIGDTSATLTVGDNQIVGATGSFTVQSNGPGGSASALVTGGTLAAGTNMSIQGMAMTDAATGNGTSGSASFTQTGGTVSVGALLVGANATGQTRPGVAGSGTGGNAQVNLLGGTFAASSVTVSANGTGGAGQAGDNFMSTITPAGAGGAGQGGQATITIDGASVTVGSMTASAGGTGGTGGTFSSSFGFPANEPGGDGGTGTGGSATINVVSGSLGTDTLTASAAGIGGTGGLHFPSSSSGASTGIGIGGDGGNGQGGSATIALEILATGVLSSVATGNGGAGGFGANGGNGGDGSGGLAQLIVDDFDAAALNVAIDSSAAGGAGSDGGDGAGGNGGDASGGTARFRAQGTNGAAIVTPDYFLVGGNGGAGGAGGLPFSANPTVAPNGGNGGDAIGGTIEVLAIEGATVTLDRSIEQLPAGPILFSSSGFGGDGGTGSDSGFLSGLTGGNGGNGGSGTGGTVRLAANDGTIQTGGINVEIQLGGASGSGGDGGIGTGANGTAGDVSETAGGTASIEAMSTTGGDGGLIDLGPTTITANGDEAGRIALLSGTGGTISMASLSAQALASGPTSGFGGFGDLSEAADGIFVGTQGGVVTIDGGASLATTSAVGVYGENAGIFDVGGDLSIQAGTAIGVRHIGRGAAPTIGAGGNMTATASSSILGDPGTELSAGGTMRLTSVNLGINVDRLAANDIFVNSQGATIVEHAEAVNDFTASFVGLFRTGTNSIITGGDISIFSATSAELGNSTAGGFVSVNAMSIDFNAIDAGLFVDLFASGTAPNLRGIGGGSIAADQSVFLSAYDIAVTGPVAAGTSLLAFGTGGDVGIAQASSAGTTSIFAAGNLTGSYVAGGDIFLNSEGDITASARANGGYVDTSLGDVAEGNLFVDAAGNVTLTDSAAARMFGVNAGQAAAITGGTAGEDMLVIAQTDASLTNVTAGDDIDVRAAGNIALANATTTGLGPDDHSLTYVPFDPNSSSSSGSSVGFTIDSTAANTARIAADAGGAVTGSNWQSGGTTQIAAATGAAAVDGLASAGPISVSADTATIAGRGNVAFASIVTDVGGATVTNDSGSVAIASATIAGTANVRTTGANAITLGQLAANAVDVSAGGTLAVNGVVSGQTIALGGADIAIGSAGRVGAIGSTQTVSLTNSDTDSQTFVGGTGTRNGFHLDAAEIARVFGGSIAVFAPAVTTVGGSSVGTSAPPDLVIDSFTLSGGGNSPNIGPNGFLTLSTPGKARVIGNVQMTNMGSANGLDLIANEALEVILGQGSVRLSNGTAPAGTLTIISDDIIVATTQAIGDVAAATTTDAISTRLAQNDGVTSDEGALFAGRISVNVSGGFYVQNSGAGTDFAQRRGLTFGAGGLDIGTNGPARIVINGVHLGPNGQITGLDAIPLLNVNGSPVNGPGNGFDARSTFNGCIIANPASCAVTGGGNDSFASLFPVQDVVEREEDEKRDETGEGSLPVPLITMRDIDPMTGEPLLDDPVTGAGNDDLWAPPGD